MKRGVILALALLIPGSAIAQGSVYSRAWCDAPAHGRSASGYGWISEVFVGNSSDECWRFANGHSQQGHKAGCSWVDPRTGELPGH